jgi:hypothetical protein
MQSAIRQVNNRQQVFTGKLVAFRAVMQALIGGTVFRKTTITVSQNITERTTSFTSTPITGHIMGIYSNHCRNLLHQLF